MDWQTGRERTRFEPFLDPANGLLPLLIYLLLRKFITAFVLNLNRVSNHTDDSFHGYIG